VIKKVEEKLRRRERLTGFLIIFILLTFSAYSNSMNVGGRMSQTNIQPKVIKQNNTKDVNSNLTNNSNTNRRIENDKNLDRNVNLDNSRDNNDDQNKKKENQERTFEKVKKKPLIERVKVHTVESGETLWDIAHKHSLNIDSLIGANNISNMNSIKPGQEFKVLPIKGILYRVSPGESLGSIASKFKIKKETIMKDNNLDNPSNLKIDQELILRGAKPEFSYRDRLDQKFMYPINTRITSYYGPRWGRIHEGIDFAAPMGSPIKAVSSGRVVYSGWANGYGYVVIVEHQKGLRTLYAHNSKLLVRVGESVGRGEVISRSGNTGNSTGPHLHFEVQVNGRPENPLDYIHR
jgi:murein DD-endopeptidase MepM/ murein hydrolase activator NlpD